MEYRNILLIKMSSLGDILHTLPFAAALRGRFPTAKISWLVHPQFAGFVPEPPVIDEILYFDKQKFLRMSLYGKWLYFLAMRRLLRSRHFDLVIDMQGLFKSAVLAAATGCNERIGYCEMREGSGLVSRAICGSHSGDHVMERYLDVARYLGADTGALDFPLPDLRQESLAVQAMLNAAGIKDRYAVLVPGARWVTKEWPPGHYARLAQMLAADGLDIVLAGARDDAAKAEAVRRLSGLRQIADLTGRTSLRELAALIKGCVFYASGDTGPLHVAVALQKPLAAMYGPTLAGRTGPYGNPQATVLLSPAPCAGCLKKHCRNWHCMSDITPEAVYAVYKQKTGGAND